MDLRDTNGLNNLYESIIKVIDATDNNQLSRNIRTIFADNGLVFPDWRDHVTRNVFTEWKHCVEKWDDSEFNAFYQDDIIRVIAEESGLRYGDLKFNHNLFTYKCVKDTFDHYNRVYSFLGV